MIDAHALLLACRDALRSDPELRAELRALLTESSDKPIPLSKCGESVRTLRAAIAAGELDATKCGRSYYVTRDALEAWRVSRRVQPRERAQREPSSPAERAIERARRSGALRLVGGR